MEAGEGTSGEGINLSRLERELVSAVEADRRYSRENDAKFRAVKQKVASYEEFRDIVRTSHLSPLDRKDLVGGSRKQPWNPVAHTSSTCSGGGGGESTQVDGDGSQQRLPRNVQEFTREWRRLKQGPVTQQYQFLTRIEGAHYHHIFRVEISMALLGEMLVVLNEGWQSGDAPSIYSILSNLARSSRFSLSVDFLSKREKQAASELFTKLVSQDIQTEDESQMKLDELAKLYSVKLVT